ncbi:hypothetical protein SDC9_168004 [bioreactor metagenome]|uniref:Uncharacterized protein n=1 Tax=bioreactor metagenome TaxID=1076179 RepID=A0A645G1W7_9ZZZZ
MVHIAPSDDELAHIVQAMLVEDLLGQRLLLVALAAARLRHRGEPHRAATSAPVVEAEFLQVGHA